MAQASGQAFVTPSVLSLDGNCASSSTAGYRIADLALTEVIVIGIPRISSLSLGERAGVRGVWPESAANYLYAGMAWGSTG